MRRPGVSTITRRTYPTGVREVAVGVTNLWRSPAAVRPVDGLMTRRVPDPGRWLGSLHDDDRRELDSRLDTQLLLGEPVRILEQHGEWSRVSAVWQPSRRHESGYPGWVRTEHLAGAAAPSPSNRWAVVTAHDAIVIVDRTGQHIPVSYGTCLRVLEGTNGLLVSLPGRRVGHLPAAVTTAAPAQPRPRTSELLLRHGRSFIGLPYLWGGLSSWGTDCSGLVHLTYRALGVVVPRDAEDQHAASRPVARAQPGDLYFFLDRGHTRHHVGIVTAASRILHAPGAGHLIEEVDLPPERATTLIGAGRIEA